MPLQLVYLLKIFICRRFGTWPVAKLIAGMSRSILEGPICNGSLVIGWHIHESRMRLRRFHAEISGFAFNSTILWDPERWHRRTLEPVRQLDTVRDGFQVSLCCSFIIHLLHLQVNDGDTELCDLKTTMRIIMDHPAKEWGENTSHSRRKT